MKDELLLELLREDFQQGYEKLIDIYIGFVYVIARSKLCNISSEEDIEEFVSDIFYLFSRQIEQIDLSKGSIKSYLSIMAKRKAISRYHMLLKKRQHISIDDEEDIISLNNSENIERLIIEKEINQQLIIAVKRLGVPDAEIIIRKYYFGQNATEIGKDISMKPKTVAKRAERALNKLKNIFGGDFL